MPSITQLHYILAVDRFRNFGKAAKACSVSQPSLSLQIQKVEEDLGFLIFDRNKRPILPSHRGLRFLEEAKNVLRAHDRMMEQAKRDGEMIQGSFRLALIPTLLPILLPYFLETFVLAYPEVTLHIEERTTESCILALREDHIDAAILATPLKERGIREYPLFYEEFFLFASKGHPLLKQDKISAQDVRSDDIWLLQDGHCLRNQIVSFCAFPKNQTQFHNLHFEGNSLESLRLLIRSIPGYTLFPQLYVEAFHPEEREKHVRSFKSPIPMREVSLVCTRNQWKKDIMRALERSIIDSLPPCVSRTKKGTVLNI